MVCSSECYDAGVERRTRRLARLSAGAEVLVRGGRSGRSFASLVLCRSSSLDSSCFRFLIAPPKLRAIWGSRLEANNTSATITRSSTSPDPTDMVQIYPLPGGWCNQAPPGGLSG